MNRIGRMFARVATAARRLPADAAGSIAVEFALTAPIMLLAMAGAIDVGRAAWYSAEMAQVTRAGLQYATLNPTDTTGTVQAMALATTEASRPGYSATAVNVCTCGASNAAAVSCASTNVCSGGPPNFYMSVSASFTYTPILGGMVGNLAPGTASSTGILRVK